MYWDLPVTHAMKHVALRVQSVMHAKICLHILINIIKGAKGPTFTLKFRRP